ncbi:expressed unknown protein [Ectocarpus siliculosus]|uniref:Uncharacterized protein n=1 Tax=Ectocarpus siliculosus TaxID=2880 RepID=D7FWH5_ECTSI|nr:expressed unknown protein [Ectocarpus siliculosus]|eukprot:CBJ32063.1 expressed unknown protein [Ectocarpus siliculosus]
MPARIKDESGRNEFGGFTGGHGFIKQEAMPAKIKQEKGVRGGGGTTDGLKSVKQETVQAKGQKRPHPGEEGTWGHKKKKNNNLSAERKAARRAQASVGNGQPQQRNVPFWKLGKETHAQRLRSLAQWRRAGGQVVEDEARIANVRRKEQAGMKVSAKERSKAETSMRRMIRAGIYTGWDDTTPNVKKLREAREGLPEDTPGALKSKAQLNRALLWAKNTEPRAPV